MNATASRFKKDMIQAAAKVAAMQLGISIALMCIPVVGWALAAIYALVNLFTGSRVKGKINDIMRGLKKDLNAKQQATQEEVHAEEARVGESLWPEASKLALSNEPLEGLGDFWSKAKDVVKKGVHAIVKVHTVPVKIVGQQTIKSWQMAAKLTGDTKLQHKLKGKEDSWAEEMDRTTKKATAALMSPDQMWTDVKRVAGVITGDEQILKAREGAAKVKKTAYEQMDRAREEALAGLHSAEYRAEMIRSMARGIRGDPKLMEEARYFQEQEQKLALANGLPSDAVVPTVPASSAGLLTVAAAVGALFFMRH
jgi:F0F1-type ATP synthase membrane subunit b/b'